MAADSNTDHWRLRDVRFASLNESREAINNPEFLDTFFEEWTKTLNAVDAAPQVQCSTRLAREVTRVGNGVNVLMIGETGAGKSLLVKVMTGDESVRTSATSAGTLRPERYETACRLNFVDTPGFKLPLSPEEARQEETSWWTRQRDEWAWRRWLAEISSMISSSNLRTRPSVVLYCHRGSSRIISERMLEMFRIPHHAEVPLIIALTDVCSVDDEALKAQKAALARIIKEMGPNLSGRLASLIPVNSEEKTVRGHKYKATGVKELTEEILNSLRPIHALQLLTRPWLLPVSKPRVFVGPKGGDGPSSKRSRCEVEQEDAEADEEEEAVPSGARKKK